jgi:hypothetical protein
MKECRLSRDPQMTSRLTKSRRICLIGGVRRDNRSGTMATGKQLKAAIIARRAAKGPRKKRTRPEPRQYTLADPQRARDRVAAAERRIDNDRSSNPNRGRAGLEWGRARIAATPNGRRTASGVGREPSGQAPKRCSPPSSRIGRIPSRAFEPVSASERRAALVTRLAEVLGIAP